MLLCTTDRKLSAEEVEYLAQVTQQQEELSFKAGILIPEADSKSLGCPDSWANAKEAQKMATAQGTQSRPRDAPALG